MSIRTDLAIENENLSQSEQFSQEKLGEIKITYAEIDNQNKFSKPKGKYITLEFPNIERLTDFSDIELAIKVSLNQLLPKNRDNILVVGLGNTEITSDSVGPKTAEKILATRHIAGQFAKNIGLFDLKKVSVIAPNVLGKTGLEAAEIITSICKEVKPDAVIVIDALCSKSVKRLFSTIQMCDSGISPGSGVKNSRKEISFNTLGVPVVAVGIPTVVEADTIAFELTGKKPKTDLGLIVSPKEADIQCRKLSEILSNAINVFLQPKIDPQVILNLV